MSLTRFFLVLLITGAFAQADAIAQSSQPPAANKAAVDNQACISCHSDVADKIKNHGHGSVACQTCHTRHEEFPHPEGVPKPSCATCHSNMARDYAGSVHGQAASHGNGAAPGCDTCHGTAHELDSAKTAKFRAEVPGLCGACHSDVSEQYEASIHGQAVKRGIMQAPVCTDCHGEHSILRPSDVASSVHSSHIRDTCGACHNDVRLTRRFGLPADRIVSFDASFHGLAAKSGTETVANCASCHSVHNIRASSDPKSTIHPSNLARTCGQCHAGAGARFSLGQIHLAQGQGEPQVLRWVRYIYLFIIPLTLGLMFLHNLGDWLRKLRHLRFVRQQQAPVPDNTESPLRTLPFERIEHVLLALSFIALGWTGFALKYPEQWWARPLLLWESARSMRGIFHRIASVVFMSAALAHILSLLFSKRLRDHWRSLLPATRDIREAVSNFLYNVGLRKEFPGRSAHSYIEKAEYWALVWGTIVMWMTGVLLWGDTFVLKWLPKIVLDVATSIHFYEAVLATLAIIIWHFYFVIFDPDVYPMDSAWLTGRSPRKETGSHQPE